MHLLTLASCVPFIPLALAVDFCPPLGAVFPLPHSLSNNSLIITAAANLTARLDALWAGGNATARLFNSTTTSLSISFFSTHEPDPLFEYHHTAEVLNTTANGTRSIAGDTVYRIGSISKVVTVLALLLHEEKFDWRDPITKYVPELSTCANNKTTDDCTAVSGVTGVMWDQVTLGALAAQLAGVPRDYSFSEISTQPLPWEALGFPTLNESSIPTCGIGESQPICTREEYLSGYKARHPVYPPFATPVYSNAAFSLLGLALEVITGRDYGTIIQNDIFVPLGMAHSSVQKPRDSKGVIPTGPSAWGFDLGYDAPAGGIYSSTTDLSAFSRAILNSTLLSPPQTRHWLKPRTHTSSLQQSVGAPWEILRSNAVTDDGRVIDFYTKNGGLGLYGSLMVLIPDYDLGLTILVAGDTSIVNSLARTVLKALIPVVERIGREQAATRYAGLYASTVPLNSSIRLVVQDGPGLKIERWISNGSDILREYGAFFQPVGAGNVDVDVRLYPTGLTDTPPTRYGAAHHSSPVQDASFRAVFQVLPSSSSNSTNSKTNNNSADDFFLQTCISWGGLDAPVYGGNALDDFVFHFDRLGNVVSLEARALRVILRKL